MFVVDLGFSSAKWLHGEDRGTVKSCFRRSKEGFPHQGTRYQVGERALLETGSRYLRTVEELMEMYPLFVSVCAKAVGILKDDVLVVGLPYDYWKAAAGKKNANNPIKVLQETLGHIDSDIPLEFGRVAVYPQGLGGIKAFLADNPSVSGNILGVDIGFNTVIYALYSCDQKEILAGRTFYRRGTHDMAVNGLLPEIQEHLHGATLTPLELDYIMRTGALQVGFDKVNITPEITEAAKHYVTDLLSLVAGDLKVTHGRTVSFDTIVFFGGGARLLAGRVAASKVKAVVLEDPEFANAIGFRIRAEELTGQD